MTDDELDRLESLWRQGVRLADIASSLGYSKGTLCYWMAKSRDRFPFRNRHVMGDDRLELWCHRIVANRATVCEAARALGVSEGTIRSRIRKMGHGQA